ncbi:MAG TPA: YkvA family protein [Spirochaetota bacterium]|nr:YkvA family protein [Spirochaetota bacterium]
MKEGGRVSAGTVLRARLRYYAALVFFAAGILYALFPLDLIPDILGPLGWVDDIGVLFVMFVFALRSYRRLKLSREALSDRRPQNKRSPG